MAYISDDNKNKDGWGGRMNDQTININVFEKKYEARTLLIQTKQLVSITTR